MSTESQSNNKRIAKNTILLYFRMLFMMAVQLYTSRVILQALGVEDYGIYNVVGGVVAMFGFLNTAMTATTQRYVTFELGKGNFQRLNLIFNTSIQIHILISVLVLTLGETIGLWFLLEKMIIPAERMESAMWVYQLSILTTIVAIMSFPYNAVIIAHERMSAFAYISVLEVVLQLAAVYALWLFDYDKLILYAFLIAAVQLVIRFVYSGYCSKHFPETKFRLLYDKNLYKEMLSFAGWNLWGHLAAVLFGQGLNMLLNVFFGPVVNAARGISVQVQNAIYKFAVNFQMALNPQITKSYASGHLNDMHKLIYRSSKFTFCLLLVLCLPVVIEAPFILHVWLKTVPEYTVIFLRIMILTMIIDSSANPLMISASATGKVKIYQSVVGGILLSILPISYLVLKMGGAPWSVFVVHLCVCCVAYITRLFIIRPLINLRIRTFSKEVILRCMLVASGAIVLPLSAHIFLSESIINSLFVITLSALCAAISSMYLGLDRHERCVILSKVRNIVSKLSRK